MFDCYEWKRMKGKPYLQRDPHLAHLTGMLGITLQDGSNLLV